MSTETSDKIASRLRIVWDNHACLPMRSEACFLPQLERYRSAGVNVVSVNVGFGNMSWVEHLRTLENMRSWILGKPETFSLVTSGADVWQCKADGKLGITFDVEGMTPVEADPQRVAFLYARGVRWMLIAYNRNNAAGGGCLDKDGGLTPLGRAIIDEMERVGMVLCLSHTGARTVAEALEYARKPVIFSHSNPYGMTPHPRNVRDQLLRACAHKGGVIGLSGIGPFLGGNTNLLQRLLRQLRYTIDLVGAEHVGLGLDFVADRGELDDYAKLNPALIAPGIGDTVSLQMIAPEAIGEIADRLACYNLSEANIQAILGGNWLRVATHVWR